MSTSLLVAEGKHEAAGALQKLVSRVLGGNHKFVFQRLANSPGRVHGKGRGYEKKAIRWLIEAQKSGGNALVLLVDRDGNTTRESEIDAAQQYSNAMGDSFFPRAMGVAVEMFDAWVFADEKALSQVLGKTIQTQKHPERIANPKEHLRLLLQSEASVTANADLYYAVAEKTDLEQLTSRCPRGFGTFAQRIKEMRL